MNKAKCYAILEISSSNPNIEDIHRAYKKLVLRYHPDKNPNSSSEASERFIEIYQAHRFLMNIYDSKNIYKNPETNNNKNPPIVIDLPVSLTRILYGCTVKKTITRTVLIRKDRRVVKQKVVESIEVHVPPGTVAGTRIQIPKVGNQLTLDQQHPGDVIFVIRDKPSRTFRRVNQVNLELELAISAHKYRVGGVVEIQTLENRMSGHREWRQVNTNIIKRGVIRIKGRGLPYEKCPEKRGDLIVRFKVDQDDWLVSRLDRLVRKLNKL